MSSPEPMPPTPPLPAAPTVPVTKKGVSPVLLAISGLLMLGGIAFVALTLWQKGLLGGFLAKPTPTPTLAPEPTPTPDPTADWKIYTNTKYNYQVKYPPTWMVRAMDGDKQLDQISKVNFRVITDEIPTVSGFDLSVIPNPDNLSLTDWVKQNPDNGVLLPSFTKEIESSLVLINGLNWERIEGDSIGYVPSGYIKYGLAHRESLYYVAVIIEYDIDDLDQILSTFKFLDQDSSQAETMENWKTYTNSLFAFEIKYPSEWTIRVPSLEGKHEDNKTVLQVDLSNSKDFKNAAVVGGDKMDFLSVSLKVWDRGNKDLNLALREWDDFRQNQNKNVVLEKLIDKAPFIRRELKNAEGTAIVEYVAEKGRYLYILTITPQESSLIGVSDQILSTFKFLE